MDEIYLAQSWMFKKNNIHNDDVDIMGVFRNLENARIFVNDRFIFFLSERYAKLCNILFPKIKHRDKLGKEIRTKFDDFVTRKILNYIYHQSNTLEVGSKIPNKEYNNQTIKIKLTLNKCFLQLNELQVWISNHTPDAYFFDYCEVPIIINDEITGSVKRMSSETCRITINDITGNILHNSFYLGPNMIDIEDCEHREKHFCTSHRIFTKTFRD